MVTTCFSRWYLHIENSDYFVLEHLAVKWLFNHRHRLIRHGEGCGQQECKRARHGRISTMIFWARMNSPEAPTIWLRRLRRQREQSVRRERQRRQWEPR